MSKADWYAQQLRSLLPPGEAIPKRVHALLNRFLGAVGVELARVDARGLELIEEADPRTTVELLTDWERVAGLPDPCLGLSPTLAARRASLISKLTRRGGQSRDYYIAVAADLGFPITIDEFRPWTVIDPVDQPLYGDEWWFAWRVNAPEVTVRDFTVQSFCNEPLRTWGNEVLECVISRLSPAHTVVLFSYGA